MKKKYIQVSLNSLVGGYIDTVENVHPFIKQELTELDLAEGDFIALSVVEMEEEEFKNLKEFTGW